MAFGEGIGVQTSVQQRTLVLVEELAFIGARGEKEENNDGEDK